MPCTHHVDNTSTGGSVGGMEVKQMLFTISSDQSEKLLSLKKSCFRSLRTDWVYGGPTGTKLRPTQ